MFLEQNPVLLVGRYLRARESDPQSKLQCVSSSDVPDAVLDARNTEAKRGLSGPTFWGVCGHRQQISKQVAQVAEGSNKMWVSGYCGPASRMEKYRPEGGFEE